MVNGNTNSCVKMIRLGHLKNCVFRSYDHGKKVIYAKLSTILSQKRNKEQSQIKF